MTTTHRALAARIGVWLLAIVTSIVGLCLLNVRSVVVWTDQNGNPDVGSAEVVDVSGTGLALLCVGLVILAGVLVAEGYRTTPDTVLPHKD